MSPPRINLHAVAGADEVFVAVDVVHAAGGGPVFVVAGGGSCAGEGVGADEKVAAAEGGRAFQQ
jgi:hypothetical protein